LPRVALWANIFPSMRKLFLVAAGLLVVHAALLFAGGRSVAEDSRPGATNVGIVLDVGGRGDKSFNDGAYAGADSATKVLHPNIRFIEPGEGSDREAGLRLLAAEKMNLVIGVGFIFSDDLTKLAKEYPGVSFAGVDYALSVDDKGNVIPPPPNLAALKFREEEGSFLVGAMAALVSKSKKIGFVGGMDIPLIHKFEAGYRAGVKQVCPDCTVVAQYAGVTPEAFTPLSPAIIAAAGLMADVVATRRILIVLTDGDCDYGSDAVATACRVAATMGVEAVGIGMQAAGVTRAFPPRYSVNVQDLDQLAQVGLGVLVDMLEDAAPMGTAD